jgi:hypothetical protein
LRRTKVSRPRARARPRGRPKQADTAALAEVKSLAETLEVPLIEVAELLADDREDYVPPAALIPAVEASLEGSLYTKSTVDAYIAAIIEL